MIPKSIHYCWFGNNLLSDLNKRTTANNNSNTA